MERFERALDQMGTDLRQSIDRLRTDMQEQYQAVKGSLDRQEQAITALQEAAVQTNRAVLRQAHILDQGLANAADTWERHRENVGNAVHSYVDDMNALKTEVRGLSSRVDALERRTPPAD